MLKFDYRFLQSSRLLNQVVDPAGEMGIVYERSVGFSKSFHVHDRHMLVCPRGSCRMKVQTEPSQPFQRPHSSQQSFEVDATQVLWVPKKVLHDDQAQSSIYDTFALYPSDELVSQMFQENALTARQCEVLQSQILSMKRSQWLDDLLDRYFHERILWSQETVATGPALLLAEVQAPIPQRRQLEMHYLEKMILNEVVRLISGLEVAAVRTASAGIAAAGNDSVEDAIQFIESKLFNELTLEQMAAAALLSSSGFLKKFKKATGRTPYQYVKERRLDEAMHLLKQGGGDVPVGDVALLVGYEDFSAFSRAFKAHFGVAPSSLVDK